jgi:toxin ParE1/3/4
VIRWTDEAQADFAGQIAWIHERNPAIAERVAEDVLASVELLGAFPYYGRAGRREGTRELATTPRPYVVVYKVLGADVVILRVLHGAQLWPPAGK